MAQSLIKRPETRNQLPGFVIVAVSMVALYVLPSGFFVLATFVSTSCMLLVAFFLTSYSKLFKPSLRSIGFGLLTAKILYAIFLVGNYGVQTIQPVGISAANENSIYSLISSHPLVLQIAILAFDTFGFESYFRGNLQSYLLERRIPAIACIMSPAIADALIHLVSLNPLWVITTFIADSVWGATYYYTKDISSSITSHFVWDVLIFILAPIK